MPNHEELVGTFGFARAKTMIAPYIAKFIDCIGLNSAAVTVYLCLEIFYLIDRSSCAGKSFMLVIMTEPLRNTNMYPMILPTRGLYTKRVTLHISFPVDVARVPERQREMPDS